MTDNAYTPEDFARCFSLRGYGRRKAALKWCEQNKITAPTEDDFERCYYALNPQIIAPHNRRYIALHCDGQNPVAMDNMPNSSGRSYAEQMRIEQHATDRLNRMIERRMGK